MGILIVIGLLGLVLLILILAAASMTRSQASSNLPRLSDSDAKKFAELLVAEIKLSNLNRVEEGRAGKNLDRVFQKEIAIAGRTYKDRVGNPEQFGYFEDALVNVLAEGNRHSLGKDHFHNYG